MEDSNQANNQQDLQELTSGLLCQNLSSSAYTIPKNANSIKVKLFLMKNDFTTSMAQYSSSLNVKYTNYITSLNALSVAGGSTELIGKFIKIQETLQSAIKNNLKLMDEFLEQANIKHPKPGELIQGIKKNIKEPDIQKEVNEYMQAKNALQDQSQVIAQDQPQVKGSNDQAQVLDQGIGVAQPIQSKLIQEGIQQQQPIQPPLQNPIQPMQINSNNNIVIENKEPNIEPQVNNNDIIIPNYEVDGLVPIGDLIKFQVIKSDDIQAKQSELNAKAKNIRKLKISNQTNESINTLFKIKSALNEMTSLTIKRSSFDNPHLRKFMPNLRYLKLSSISTHLSAYNLFISFPKLRELRLNSVNLRNKSFKAIMSSLLNQTNEEMAGNLEVISFKNNKINTVALAFPKGRFDKLRLLDFENNKLHTFTVESFASVPSLQYINLSSNDFLYCNTFDDLTRKAKEDNSRVSIIMGSNQFIIKEKSRAKYIDYLAQVFSMKDINYSLPSMTFSYLFNRSNKSKLVTDFIGYNIWNKLNELNLSFCQLKNDDLMKIFEYNKNSFDSLNKLNVSSNDIDDDIFKMFNEKAPGKLRKLKEIDLSHTLVKGNNRSMVPFLKASPKMKKMKIYSSPFEESFGLFLRGLIETMKKQEGKDKDKPLNLKSEIEIAMNEFNALFATFDQIGTIKVKMCLQVTSTTVCRKLQKSPPECGKYFEIKE